MKYSDSELLELKRLAEIYCRYNYDYCYLSAMYYKNRTEGTKTIIVGSSHAMNGIVESAFDERPINFSISSQDLYYDFQHIQKAVKEGAREIKNCIINLGYYMMYQDISLSKNIGKFMVPRIYFPLFGEPHHYSGPVEYDRYQTLSYDREKYPEAIVKKVCESYSLSEFMKNATYYGMLKTREQNSLLACAGGAWQELPQQEKESLAIQRTEDHNHIRTYIASRQENGELVQEMVCFLAQRNIRIVFVIFPFTSYYNKYIDAEYRQDIINVLEGLEQPVEFLDMNDLDLFDAQDFVDTDHLNERGAFKASCVLNEFLSLYEEDNKWIYGRDMRNWLKN